MKRTTCTMLLTLLIPVSLQATADELRLRHNPFLRPTLESTAGAPGAAATGGELTLRATLTDHGQALANINGRLIRPGDEINGYRIVTIDEGSVVLSRGAQERRLTVRNEHTE